MEKSKYPHSQRVNPITMQSPGPQFPSKYGALPSIQNRNSPIPTKDNQVVPMDHSFDAEPEERLRHLETRVNVTEKSNRALLEEVVRLQSELKTNVRRSEDVLREERQTRLQLENSLRASNDLIAQLSSRLKRTEDKIAEERMAISALVNHTKSVEQAVLGSQQELVSRKEAQTARLQEMKEELEEVSRAKDQLERLTFNLVDEMRQLKGRMDNQNMDFASVANDLKNKNKRLEEENRQTLESVRKHAEVQSLSDSTSSQLRQQIESRLSELRDVLVDLRGKQEGETQERRMLEQAVQKKISELMSNIAEQNRKREEAMHALDSIQREREHAAETERIKLQGKIAETAEEVSKKILQKEIKLREESQEKFNMVEKLISNEQSARMAFESDLRRELDKRWDSVKKSNEGDLQAVKQAQKLERAKTSETLHKLDEAVDLLQGQIEQYKKQQEKLLSAEIKSRKTHERDTREKVENLQEKLGIATSTLQAAVGGIMTKLQTESDRLKAQIEELEASRGRESQLSHQGNTAAEEKIEELKHALQEVEEKLNREISKITEDEQERSGKALSDLHDKISQLEGNLEAKAAAEMIEEMKKTIERVDKKLKKEMKSIAEEEAQKNTRLMADLDTRVTGLNSKISNVEDSLEAKITGSSAAQAQNMRDKVESISLWQDVTSQSIRDIQYKVQELPMEVYQLQEKHELLKSDLTGKVTAEAESRKRDVENLRRDLSRLVAAPGKGLAGDKTATKSDFDAYKLREDIDECQESLHKLAESVQTIKTVLGMKIATESKLRVEEVKNLQDELNRLRGLVDPLLTSGSEPKVFVKPTGASKEEAESQASSVNRWGVYSAYKWNKIKNKMKGKKKASKKEARSPSPSESTTVPVDVADVAAAGIAEAGARRQAPPSDDETVSAPPKKKNNKKAENESEPETEVTEPKKNKKKAKEPPPEDSEEETTAPTKNKSDTKPPPKKKQPPAESEDESEAPPPKKKQPPPDSEDEDDESEAPPPKKKQPPPESDDETEAPPPKKKGQKPPPDSEDDDETEAPPPKKNQKPPPDSEDDESEAPPPKKKQPPPDSEDDDETEAPPPKKKSQKPPPDSEDDESEAPPPKKKQPPPDSDDETEAPPPKKKGQKPPPDSEDDDETEVPPPKKNQKPPPDSEDDESEAPPPKKKQPPPEDSEEDSEDEAPPPKKQPDNKKKPPPPADDDETESEDEPPPPKKQPDKKKPPPPADDDETESEDEPPPPKKQPDNKKKPPPPADDDDETESEDEPPPPKKQPDKKKPPPPADDDETESEDEPPPPKKQPDKKKPPPPADDDETESEDEPPPPKSKGKPPPKKPPPPDDDDDDSEDDDDPPPRKPPAKRR
ncbi:neurofilament heavy polypeptide isoform X2 [Lingula anatina]|uniref:Neurofilament heavy polypeptide isoform X2 n=1 Tax=Lingula anatina TaxID=7574 RepID=A0A1S3H7J0_LINAN|nr:neurofilament heavy polypeptide isoform X2 [Lingula anatina]|eukprot:XP_013381947.1 neurofilament heavy polypeptide isoform X2 [Lingula anatina]